MKGIGRMKKQNLQRIILKETALFTELYKLYKHVGCKLTKSN